MSHFAPAAAAATAFCFVTSSHEQPEFVPACLASIASQKYSGAARIVYIDDGSTDDTADILKAFQLKHRATLPMVILRNETRQGPAQARWRGCQLADCDEVCVFLDGDDELAHPNVLAALAKEYETGKVGGGGRVMATFGSMTGNEWQYAKWTTYSRRDATAHFPHLRTAVARYAQAVPETHLKDAEGKWFMFCSDVALFMGIVERIGHFNGYSFIREGLCVYVRRQRRRRRRRRRRRCRAVLLLRPPRLRSRRRAAPTLPLLLLLPLTNSPRLSQVQHEQHVHERRRRVLQPERGRQEDKGGVPGAHRGHAGA